MILLHAHFKLALKLHTFRFVHRTCLPCFYSIIHPWFIIINIHHIHSRHCLPTSYSMFPARSIPELYCFFSSVWQSARMCAWHTKSKNHQGIPDCYAYELEDGDRSLQDPFVLAIECHRIFKVNLLRFFCKKISAYLLHGSFIWLL